MTPLSAQDWIEVGRGILASEGDGALTVDALCARLGKTKGSFYHHFADREAYARALLDQWSRSFTEEIFPAVEQEEDLILAFEQLHVRLHHEYDMRLDRAIRVWSLRSPEVSHIVHGFDEAWIDFLTRCFLRLTGNAELAQQLAMHQGALFIGASMMHLDRPALAQLVDLNQVLINLLLSGRPDGTEG